jgi:hypothetical protein
VQDSRGRLRALTLFGSLSSLEYSAQDSHFMEVTAVDFNAEKQICIASIGKMKKIILDDGKRKIEN